MTQQSFRKSRFSVRRSIASGLVVMEAAITLTIASAFVSAPFSSANAQPSSSGSSAADLGEPVTVNRSTEQPLPVPDVQIPPGRLDPSEPSSPEIRVGGPTEPRLRLPSGSIQVNLFDPSCTSPDRANILCVHFESGSPRN